MCFSASQKFYNLLSNLNTVKLRFLIDLMCLAEQRLMSKVLQGVFYYQLTQRVSYNLTFLGDIEAFGCNFGNAII